jgi:hypothetical protein
MCLSPAKGTHSRKNDKHNQKPLQDKSTAAATK